MYAFQVHQTPEVLFGAANSNEQIFVIQHCRGFVVDLAACLKDGRLQMIGMARPELRMYWQLKSCQQLNVELGQKATESINTDGYKP